MYVADTATITIKNGNLPAQPIPVEVEQRPN